MKDTAPPSTASLGFGITPKEPVAAACASDGALQAARKARILLVDSDKALHRFMKLRLTVAGYAVESVASASAALDACSRSRPDLVITDLHLERMDGLALLKELKTRWPALTVIILTAYGTIAQAVQATQRGAFGFLIKPVEKRELLGQVQRAIATSTFTLNEGEWRSQIVSRSQLMEDRLGLANQSAGSDVPVLLTGESGTGKELLARAIHAASARRQSLFVAVSCRGPAEQVLAVELFGRTAALPNEAPARRLGAFAAARGGTLLLDEIDTIPLGLQGELSVVLKKGTDVRLICTTSRDLKMLMNDGKFREDLYHQINILRIEIPPLGRRREDIPLLISHFLAQATGDGGREALYTPQAMELLATSDWPGNVRQLFELVKRNVALSRGRIMTKEFVQRSLGKDAKTVPTYDQARDEFALAYLKSNLRANAGNVNQSARLAKRNRTDFYKLLARYRLHPDDYKTSKKPESDD